ncbi:MAG: ribose-phosphate diphosphokinase [Pseudomonadota bacterium]
MTKPLLFTLPGGGHLADRLAKAIGAEHGDLVLDAFPDGETYLRYHIDLAERDVILLAGLDRPNEKTLPVIFAAGAARSLGARSVGLAVPYLPYMRQDTRFNPGESVTSVHFAHVLSEMLDWLVTMDPHLHRRQCLSEIYSIRTQVTHAAPFIADWIAANVERPLIIGPDAESEQWVEPLSHLAGADFIVMEKHREASDSVTLSAPDLSPWTGHQVILIDDVISTAGTLATAVHHVLEAGLSPPLCVTIHGVFAAGALERLESAGADQIVTCNTIEHSTNAIDIAPALADGVKAMLMRD